MSMEPASSQKSEVLAIIPARGGSRGVPRKNVRDLCGKPLVAYSIQVALKSKHISRVIVSTDDEEIAEISQAFGAEVPFLRPKSLAGDRSDISTAIHYTASRLLDEGYEPDALVRLYPTHLFRTPALIDFLTNKIAEGFSPVGTFKRIDHASMTIFSKNSDNLLTSLHGRGINSSRDCKHAYFRQYGLFSGTGQRADNFYVHVIRDPISLIDIDTMSDFFLAEEIIKQGLFDFDLNDPDVFSNAGSK